MDVKKNKGGNIKGHMSMSHADSTKSANEILKYLEGNNLKAFRHYCKLLGRRKAKTGFSHHIIVGHPLNTFPEDWDGVLPTGYFEKYAYKSSYPKAITPLRNVGCADPVTDIMHKKHFWEIQALSTENRLGRYKSNGEKTEVEMINEEVGVCSSVVVDAAVLQALDPDTNFNYPYNWYYSGHGNMHIISLGGSDYVLHSVLNCLFLSKFSKEQLNIDQNHIFQYNCGKDTFILETIHSVNNFVALRLKNRVIVLKIIILDGAIQIGKLKEIQNDFPYTSISFDSHHKNILYVTTLDNTLSIVNMDLMKRRTVNLPETKKVENNWSMVEGCDRNTYVHVSRKSISVYDKRTNGIVQSWSDIINVVDTTCNQMFSGAKMCEDIPFMYLGTDHHLFLMDLRCSGKNGLTPVQRWTHNMISPPTGMSLCKFEVNKDLLCVSSQLAFEDLRILQNDSECFFRGAPVTNISMPYRPPTLEHTLSMARYKKLCLDIRNPLETRIFTSATGNAVVECGEKYLILTQNSLGDIFCHTLYPDHLTIEDDGLEKLHGWGKANKTKQRDFKFDKIADISKVWRSLQKIPESHTYGWQKLNPNEEFNYSEQEALDAFESGKIDKGLLDAWNFNQDEQKDLRPESLAIDLHFSDSE